MVIELKLRKVGNSVEVVLPKEALARLNVGEGDTLALTDLPDGSLRVTPTNEGREKFTKQMKAAESIVRRYSQHAARTRQMNGQKTACRPMAYRRKSSSENRRRT
ncbi:MAG: AbrB/MazE/SpoVT family DNA-binding domain-containing protein [Verrucomicrobiota bacterium]